MIFRQASRMEGVERTLIRRIFDSAPAGSINLGLGQPDLPTPPALALAGIDAVGIGSDFDGVKSVPTGLEDVSKFPNLTRALLEEGYSASDIGKIYGGNTLRLMRAVEKVAVELKSNR